MAGDAPWTPGPWGYKWFGGPQIGGGEDTATAVCTLWGSFRYGTETSEEAANARLIAAAPELADEVAKAIDIFEGDLTGAEWKEAWRSWCSRNRALLTRIKGEPK